MPSIRLCVAVVALLAASAAAFPMFLDLIPNGRAAERPGSGITCLYFGHQQCIAGAIRNAFGLDFKAQGLQWTKELCETDSDGDGLTNGQELGDPCCVWTVENADSVELRLTDLSHPGDASETNTAPTECPDTAATDAPTVTPSPSMVPPPSSSSSSSPVAEIPTPTASASTTAAPSMPAPTVEMEEEEVDDEEGAMMTPAMTPMITMEAEEMPTPSSSMSASASASASTSMSMSASPSMSMLPSETPEPATPEPTISDEPIVSPSEEPDDPVCFPAHAHVTLADGSHQRMDKVKIGDVVLVGPGMYSRVFMMSHADSGLSESGKTQIADFLTLTLSSGTKLSLTKGHYLYVQLKDGEDEKLVRADGARVGDSVTVVRSSKSDGVLEPIVSIEAQRFRGLFNPQTLHGDIVVNDVKASTYTTAIHAPTAHSLLAPLRALFRTLRWSTAAFESSGRAWLQMLPRGRAEL